MEGGQRDRKGWLLLILEQATSGVPLNGPAQQCQRPRRVEKADKLQRSNCCCFPQVCEPESAYTLSGIKQPFDAIQLPGKMPLRGLISALWSPMGSFDTLWPQDCRNHPICGQKIPVRTHLAHLVAGMSLWE